MTKDRSVQVETSRAPQGASAEAISPLVDIYEDQREMVLVAEMPGVPREAVSVQVDKGVLTVEGRSEASPPGEPYSATYVGFEPASYFRAFALSDEIDRERIAASISNGVLTIRLPKAPSAVSRRIEIKASE